MCWNGTWKAGSISWVVYALSLFLLNPNQLGSRYFPTSFVEMPGFLVFLIVFVSSTLLTMEKWLETFPYANRIIAILTLPCGWCGQMDFNDLPCYFFNFFSVQRLELSLFWIIIFKQCFLFYWFMNEKLHNFQSSVWGAP